MAERIYNLYLSSSAALEVNIPRKLANLVLISINNNHLNENLFDEIYSVVRMNLQDTLSRFRKTEAYKRFMSTYTEQQRYIEITYGGVNDRTK